MRKNSPRKWVHAILDLLPLLILPIFALAVRSDNNFQPIEVTAQENKVVDFNQQFKINSFVYDSENSYSTYSLNDNISIKLDHYYIIYVYQQYTYTSVNRNSIIYNNNGNWLDIPSHSTNYSGTLVLNNNVNDNLSSGFKYCRFKSTIDYEGDIFYWVADGDIDNNYYYINCFDLTQMFGFGNEPSFNDFYSLYPAYNYDYILSKKELLKDVNTITYSDTDVGSQMVYTLYNATDKYFNFNNVFNFCQLYDWFLLNIFGGNSTLIFPVVWNIVLYEFIMDLIFLIYALFMFFIDFCTNLIEGVHRSVR